MSKFQKVCLVRVAQDESASARIYESFPIVVGRSTETHVGVIDPGVSRLHLEINYKHGRLSVKDLGSANGTYLGGVKLEPQVATAVDPGVLLELGTNRVPVVIEMFEKSFDAKQIPKSDLTSDQKSKATNMLDAAHAEVQRLSWLFKAQQEQAEKALEEKTHRLIADAQQKAQDIVARAQDEAEKVKAAGQKVHDEVVGSAEDDAKKAGDAVLQNSRVQAEVKAKMILETAEQELAVLKETAAKDAEQLIFEGKVALQKLREEADAEIAKKEAEILENAEKKAAAQLRLAEMQGEDEVRRLMEAAGVEADALKAEAKRLHEEIHTAYEKEVERGKATVAEHRRIVEEEISARAEQSQMLLKNAVEKSTAMLDHAEKTSTEQLSTAEIKSEAMMKVAREESTALLEKTQQDILEQFTKNEAAMKQLRIDTETDLKESFEKSEAAHRELEVLAKSLEARRTELETKEERLLKVENELEEKTQMATALSENFRIAEAQLKAAQAKLEDSTRETIEAQRKKAETLMEIGSQKQEWERTKKQLEIEIAAGQEKARAEIEEYRQRSKSEIDRLKLKDFEELKAARLEEDRGIDRHRSEIVKELLKSTEMHFLNNLKGALPAEFDWAKVSEPLHGEVRMNLEELVYQLSHKEAAKEEAAGLLKNQVALKTKLKKYGMITASVFAVLLILPWTRAPIMAYLGQSSMDAAADRYSKEMQAERDRRYTPEKSRSWKDSYTEAVLYTEGFVDMKLDPKSQDKWIKELHNYLYGKLRVDEDSIVKIVSTEAALIATLKQEADQIHPDFVNEKVARMKEIEAESVAEIQKLVGKPEKYEKFRKFAQDFYYNEYLMRLPAASAPPSPPGDDGSTPSATEGEFIGE